MAGKIFKVARPTLKEIKEAIQRASEVRKRQGEAFAAEGKYNHTQTMRSGSWYESIEYDVKHTVKKEKGK